MIRALVDFALNNRFLVLAAAHSPLFVGRYLVSQAAGRSVPRRRQQLRSGDHPMAGPRRRGSGAAGYCAARNRYERHSSPGAPALRLSVRPLQPMLIFDDESDNDLNRQKVLERLAQASLPPGLQPQMGTDWSPVGQIYFYHLISTNPKYDVMELKSLEDWVLEKQFKSVPNVVDVSSLGGITREYQVRIDPDKLVSYGLSIGQVEQQLANNNVNAGGSFIEAGLAADQRPRRRTGDQRRRTSRTPSSRPRTGRRCGSRTSPPWRRAPRSGSGKNGKAIHRADGRIIDYDDVVEGIRAAAQRRGSGLHAEGHRGAR